MPDQVHLVPLAEIDAAALPRDRTGLDPEPQAELVRAIAASGLRQPVELFPLPEPRGAHRYGLLSGYRRLHAFQTLHADTGDARWSAIPAFLRPAASHAAALAAMIEENEIRAGLTPFERGRIAVIARNQGAFASIEEAVDGLYPNASRQKRQRLRTLAYFAEEMDGQLTAPEKLIARTGLPHRPRPLRRLRRPDPHRPRRILAHRPRAPMGPAPADPRRSRSQRDQARDLAPPGPPPPHPPPALRPDHPPRAHPRRLEPALHRPRGDRPDDRRGAGRHRADVFAGVMHQ